MSLQLNAGEAHALAGEKGAGKSTLIRTLAGVQRPDAGTVLIDDAPVTLHRPADARDTGIAVVYQEPTLFLRPPFREPPAAPTATSAFTGNLNHSLRSSPHGGPRPMAQSVGIKDVARAAGVSVGTVSNVINRPDSVAADTRARVLSAIDRLGYVRSESARQLRAGRSRIMGLLVLDMGNPFFVDVARGA
ncbi:LacI family DNA-binding transcriptional regulator, partial [Streptomyces sp. A475]|uniref:LacI family DNA-binding transcriptional regulator n=1 Tax=Streptomyces sp. A475 TaxID=3131976 RepID=UPI0030C8DBBA